MYSVEINGDKEVIACDLMSLPDHERLRGSDSRYRYVTVGMFWDMAAVTRFTLYPLRHYFDKQDRLQFSV